MSDFWKSTVEKEHHVHMRDNNKDEIVAFFSEPRGLILLRWEVGKSVIADFNSKLECHGKPNNASSLSPLIPKWSYPSLEPHTTKGILQTWLGDVGNYNECHFDASRKKWKPHWSLNPEPFSQLWSEGCIEERPERYSAPRAEDGQEPRNASGF